MSKTIIGETVQKIESLLRETVALQKNYVERVCAACENSCCLRVHYLFSTKDVLFLRLSGRELGWRRDASTKKGCWFLGERGCLLDPECRPFLCHTYICHDMKDEMNKWDPGLQAVLNEKFGTISRLRDQLQDKVLLAENLELSRDGLQKFKDWP